MSDQLAELLDRLGWSNKTFISGRELAEAVGVHPRTGMRRRQFGSGPPFVVLNGVIRHPVPENIRWMLARRAQNSTQARALRRVAERV